MPTLKPPPSSKAAEDAKAKAEAKDPKKNEKPNKQNGNDTTTKPANKPTNEEEALDPNVKSLMIKSLRRLTKGLPKKELRLMVQEAKAVEEALDREIKQLQQGLDPANYKDNKELEKFCTLAWESEVTPADTNFTISALLGRLRDDLAMPLPPNSTIPAHREKVGLLYQPPKKKKKTESGAAGANGDANKQSSLEKQRKIIALQDKPEYAKEHPSTTHLLAVLKKISTHRAAIVFRRPVNPKEAPGYTDRILFPMDLSMVRKMIMARMIKSYSELHQRIGLICHNCIKYNGRESDYGVVTREFEAMVDDYILSAVETATAVAKAAQAAAEQKAQMPAATAPPPPPAAAAVKKEKAPSRSNSPKPPSRSTSPKPSSQSTSPKPPSRSTSPKPASRSSSPTPPKLTSKATTTAATKKPAPVRKVAPTKAAKPNTKDTGKPKEAPTKDAKLNAKDAGKSNTKDSAKSSTKDIGKSSTKGNNKKT